MGESYENFAESAKNLSVVTFNYDRSIEYYFLNALTSSYGESRALDVLNSMKIVHVYGQLGKPDFLSPGGRSFDPELNRDTVAKCVAEIKVIPENRDGSPEFQEAAKLIESAEVVCFLGFGYNPTNIKRLAIKKHLPNDVVLGSMFGMKQNERRKAWSELTAHITTGILTQNFGEEDEDALLFLREYPVL